MTVVRAINFLYPLELPTLQEEINQQPTQDGKNVQGQRTEFNVTDDAPEEQRTVEPMMIVLLMIRKEKHL